MLHPHTGHARQPTQVRRVIRTQGRSGPFWRLSVGPLTFFGRDIREVVRRYQAHTRMQRQNAEVRS